MSGFDLSPALELEILEEYCRREGLTPEGLRLRAQAEADSKIEAIVAELFDKQAAWVLDPAKRKAADPSRRAGKTNGIARGAHISVLETPAPDDDIWTTYTAITRQQAKDLFWGPLKSLNRRHKLGGIPNETELQIRYPNGHRIKLFGADKMRELEKKRGYKVKKAYIDEAGAFPPELLRYYLDEILEPATADLDGSIELVGTPSRVALGPFYEACTGKAKGWKHHHWTLVDNPYLKNIRRWLKRLRERRGWTLSNGIYRREYGGEWVIDDEGLLFHYTDERNGFAALPGKHQWSYVLGIDLGASDNTARKSTAFTVIAYCRSLPVAFILESRKGNWMTPTEIADEIGKLRKDYKTQFRTIVADTGALGKAITREITKRHGIPIVSADKTEKMDFIELMDDDLKKGWVKVRRSHCEDLISEWALLQEDPEKPGKEDDRFPNHCSDSALYAWRWCLQYLSRPDADAEPEVGTAEHDEWVAEKLLEREVEEYFTGLQDDDAGYSEDEWFDTTEGAVDFE